MRDGAGVAFLIGCWATIGSDGGRSWAALPLWHTGAKDP